MLPHFNKSVSLIENVDEISPSITVEERKKWIDEITIKLKEKQEEREKKELEINWKWVVYIDPTYPWKCECPSYGLDKFDPLQTFQIEDYSLHMSTCFYNTKSGHRIMKDGRGWFLFDTEEKARDFYNNLKIEEIGNEINQKRKELIQLITNFKI